MILGIKLTLVCLPRHAFGNAETAIISEAYLENGSFNPNEELWIAVR